MNVFKIKRLIRKLEMAEKHNDLPYARSAIRILMDTPLRDRQIALNMIRLEEMETL